MVELIKFELKKIFSNKLVMFAASAILIFIVGFTIIIGVRNRNEVGTREEIEEFSKDYMNEDHSKEDMLKLRSDVREKYKNDEELSKKEKLLYLCPLTFTLADKNENEKMIKAINDSMDRLKDNNEKDTFQYKDLLKQKEMINVLPETESLYIGDWISALDFNLSATIKIILLTVGLAGIFSKEYSNRVAYINLSSKNGKTKLNTAKIIASFIYATMVFIFVTILLLVSASYLGLPNGDKPVSFITGSIYNMSINKFYISTLAFSYLGTLIFTILIVILSLITKNIIVEFGMPILLYFLPTIFKLPDWLNYINFSRLFSGKSILGSYESVNLFGNVVLYPYVITVTGVIAIVVMLVLYKKFGKTQTIT